MSFNISIIESYLPNKIIQYKSKKDPLIKVTGINKRFSVKENQDSLYLANCCLKKLSKKKDLSRLDFLLLVTQTSPNYFPSLSNILQHNFKLKKDILAIDLNIGCSGYVYALKFAESLFLTEEYKSGVILCVDTYTKYISKNNSSCYPIFSDAATATVLDKNKKKSKFNYAFGSDGSGSKYLYLNKNQKEMFMNGPNVALFTLKVIPKFIENFLNKNLLKKNQVKYFLFHQASKFICENIQKKLLIPKNKIYNNYNIYGNTISSSIPLLLKDLLKKKKIKLNDKLILCGFGVGLSWGIAEIKL